MKADPLAYDTNGEGTGSVLILPAPTVGVATPFKLTLDKLFIICSFPFHWAISCDG